MSKRNVGDIEVFVLLYGDARKPGEGRQIPFFPRVPLPVKF